MTFVNSAPGVRTYIAELDVKPDFAPALAAGDRGTRKSLAWHAMTAAEAAVGATLLPKLEKLKSDGLVDSWEMLPGTGAVVINTVECKSGAAWDAVRGVEELGRIVRDRKIQLDDVVVAQTVEAAGGPEYNVAKVQAPSAWAQGVTGAGVVVGLVDTGANVAHEALKSHYRGTREDGTFDHSYNFFDAVNGKKEAYDDHNHGSHVAGTSTGGTADRQIGVAPGAKFIATKVFTSGGSGSTATILRGLSWMLAPTDANGENPDPSKAPDIVSNSWGSSNGKSLSYVNAWDAFEAAGIIPVVAAGNSGPRGGTIGAPGSYKNGLTIGASDQNDKVASFSSRGPNPINGADGKPLPKPDFTAPGVSVVSAGKSGNGYVSMSGTSMATPAAAGIAALLLERFPQMTAEQMRTVLAGSAVDIDAPGRDNNTGAGRIDAVKALAFAEQLFSK